ncbi:MAG: PLP-dependent aminotransferase family protein [Oscillospiraceae bacterium]|nr:PLP-dependent aminotransferase family protein [Oscillospiraceae bacterium]
MRNTGEKSAYLRIYEAVREDIQNGRLQPGEKLPSKRMMAERTGKSVITIEHAYALLLDEGYIYAREKSGYFVSGDTMQSSRGGRSFPVPAGQSITDAAEDFPFTAYARTIRKVLSDYDRRILSKVPGSGSAELRQAIAGYLYRSRGLDVAAENIIIGSGAEHLYSLILQILGPGCCIAMEDPSYEVIRNIYQACGAQCLSLRMGENGILSDELSACRADALHVTPYHSFPTGITADAAKRTEYARWATRTGAYIIEDDYDSEFTSLKKQIDTIFSLAPQQVIYVNSFSKTMSPALRIGYMVLPDVLLQRYRQRLSFYSCTVPVFEQYVLAEFINSGELERYISRRRRSLRQQTQLANSGTA